MIQKEIIKLYPQYLAVLEDKNKEYNEIGSAINYILCNKENEIFTKSIKIYKK